MQTNMSNRVATDSLSTAKGKFWNVPFIGYFVESCNFVLPIKRSVTCRTVSSRAHKNQEIFTRSRPPAELSFSNEQVNKRSWGKSTNASGGTFCQQSFSVVRPYDSFVESARPRWSVFLRVYTDKDQGRRRCMHFAHFRGSQTTDVSVQNFVAF